MTDYCLTCKAVIYFCHHSQNSDSRFYLFVCLTTRTAKKSDPSHRLLCLPCLIAALLDHNRTKVVPPFRLLFFSNHIHTDKRLLRAHWIQHHHNLHMNGHARLVNRPFTLFFISINWIGILNQRLTANFVIPHTFTPDFDCGNYNYPPHPAAHRIVMQGGGSGWKI